MSKLDISVSASCLKLLVVLYLFIVLVSAKNIDSSPNDDSGNNENEGKQFFVPSPYLTSMNSNHRPDRSTILSDYNLPYSRLRMPLFKKRTIPIELQKALYAHGIVGRRR